MSSKPSTSKKFSRQFLGHEVSTDNYDSLQNMVLRLINKNVPLDEFLDVVKDETLKVTSQVIDDQPKPKVLNGSLFPIRCRLSRL